MTNDPQQWLFLQEATNTLLRRFSLIDQYVAELRSDEDGNWLEIAEYSNVKHGRRVGQLVREVNLQIVYETKPVSSYLIDIQAPYWMLQEYVNIPQTYWEPEDGEWKVQFESTNVGKMPIAVVYSLMRQISTILVENTYKKHRLTT